MCVPWHAQRVPLQECKREAVIGRISLAQIFVFRIHGFPSAIGGFSERGRNCVHPVSMRADGEHGYLTVSGDILCDATQQ